jgi:two-component system cell cycle sensor histidine kinase/response regulator CckA
VPQREQEHFERRLAQTQRLARIGFWELDFASDTTWWSDEFYRILGLEPGSAPPTRNTLASLLQPDDLAAVDAAIARARETGVLDDLVQRIALLGGDERRINLRGEVERDAEGHPVRLFGVCIDVTDVLNTEDAIRESEARLGDANRMLHAVLDATPVRVFWKDLDLRYLGCNTNFAKDAGFDSPSQLLGRDDFAMGWLDQAELYRADDRAVIESGESKLNYEEPQTTPDGKTIWLRTSKIPLRTAEGQIFGVLGTYEDITDYKRLAEQSLHREKLEAIGRLAGGIAHDFNNLLTVVLGNVEVAQANLKSDTSPMGPLAAIETSAKRAANLTAQLLAFARKQIIKPRAVDPSEQIKAIQRLLQPLMGEQIALEISTIDPSWMIQIDPGQFEQLLINLAVNARDAMPDGGTLSITTDNVILGDDFQAEHPEVTPGSYLQVIVKDTGSGVDASAQEHVFEPFFTTKASGKGTGLGLATCHGIVKQNGGHIGLVSEPGEGTTFEIYLPRAKAEGSVSKTPPRREAAHRGDETILLIEDEEPVRRLCAHALEQFGYTVISAAAGSEGLERAARFEGSIDALVTDVVLPDMRGPEIAERLRKMRPGVAVLFTSGYARDAIARDGVLEQGVNFLQKPFTLSKLGETVRRALDSR